MNYHNALNSKNQKEKEKDIKTHLTPFTFFLLQLKKINSVIIGFQKEAIPDIIFFLCPLLKKEIKLKCLDMKT